MIVPGHPDPTRAVIPLLACALLPLLLMQVKKAAQKGAQHGADRVQKGTGSDGALRAMRHPPAYRAGMARIPRKKPFTLTIDLLADRRPFADAPPAPHIDHDWRYFGTVTYSGTTGAPAWRVGGYGIAVGSESVREFQLWEWIRLNSIMEFEGPPGLNMQPRFAPQPGWGTPFSQ